MATVHIKADSRFPVDRKRIRHVVDTVLAEKGVVGEVQVSVAIVGDRKMKYLNEKFKKSKGTTDVLSFPYTETESSTGFVMSEEFGLILGDIVVSYPQAVQQAMEKNSLVDDKVSFLVEHGLLHLLGIHHD